MSLKLWMVLATISVPGLVRAAELQSKTLDAWINYIQTARVRMDSRADGTRPFLWLDESANRARTVRRGEVVIEPAAGRGTQEVPGGMIHHWVGAVFLPGATIENLKSVLQNYDGYQKIYRPAVVESKALGCTGRGREFSMIWQRRVLFVNAAIQGQYWSHDVMVGDHRGYEVSGTMRVQEIEDYGRRGEHLLAPDTGNGFIWRLHGFARYEERDGGVYLELEAIALTRDIPASLHWLVAPVVNHLSINSLAITLRQTRQAVSSVPASVQTAASCRSWDTGVALAKSGGAE